MLSQKDLLSCEVAETQFNEGCVMELRKAGLIRQ
jgi:hypothetical protein